MKKRERVLCIGAAHIDYKFTPNQPLIKKTSNPIQSNMNYGGVVRNVAENLSRLDIDVSLMSVVGDDLLGNQLIHQMKSLMDVKHIIKLKNQRTGQYYAALNVDGDMDIAYADMSIYDSMNAQWMLEQLNKVLDYDYYVVDMNVQKSGLNVLIQWAKTHHKKLIIIGVSEPKMLFLPQELDGVYLLMCNQNEARAYFNNMQMSEEALIKSWQKSLVESVVMTNGHSPIICVGHDNDINLKAIKQLDQNSMIDATGAGDAFSAGVIFGLIQNNDLDDALDYGIANARLTIQSKNSVREDLSKDMLIKEVR